MQKTKSKPKNWKEVKIIDYCNFERGTEPGSDNYNKEGIGIPFIRVGNISAGNQNEVYTNSDDIKTCKRNDTLISLDGSPGVVVRGFEGAYSSGIRKVEVEEEKELLEDFVFYVLQSLQVQKIIEAYSTGVTIKHAGKSLNHIEIPLPPIKEQEKIVEVLDEIQEAIDIQDDLIKKSKEMKKALMSKLFTEGTKGEKQKDTKIGKIPESWKVIELQDFINRKNETVEPKTGDKYLGLEHLNSGETKVSRCSDGSEVKSTKYSFESGDVLYGKLRPYLDKAVLVGFDGVCSTDIMVFEPKDNKTFAEYLVHFLHSNWFLIASKATTQGTNHPRTSWRALKIFDFPYPPKDEQKEIADILQKINQKIENHKSKKQKYEELFKSMFHKLMTGEIRVNNIKI